MRSAGTSYGGKPLFGIATLQAFAGVWVGLRDGGLAGADGSLTAL